MQAAKQLADYLHTIRPVNTITVDIRNRAISIASEILTEDEGLLAVALAAPSLKLAVVQFRDIVQIPPDVSNNHTTQGKSIYRDVWKIKDFRFAYPPVLLFRGISFDFLNLFSYKMLAAQQ